MMRKRILVTGGAGFIGSHLSRYLYELGHEVVVFDALTYAGYRENLSPGVNLVVGDLCEGFARHSSLARDERMERRFDVVFHLAAESHVDHSIDDPLLFTQANVLGTHALMERARRWDTPPELIVYASTDEVYGSIGPFDHPATEGAPLRPTSPYAASKAAAEHVALSYFRTFGLPIVVTRMSNVYGTHQHVEKFIPRAITAALRDEAIPIYGDGLQTRQWLSVWDAVRAFAMIMDRIADRSSSPYLLGEAINLGGPIELTNMRVAKHIVEFVGRGRIEHVTDRLSHDRHYRIDSSRAHASFGWRPLHTDLLGDLPKLIQWYRDRA